jgi:hypothetical protein
LWSSIQDMNASAAAGHKELAAEAQHTAADSEALAADAAANAERTKELLARIDRGEDVTGGLVRLSHKEGI